VLRLSDIFIT